jgi:hypothetical protein
MSQQTFNSGGTQVAEPPAPILPSDNSGAGGDDSRRKLMLVGAGVGVLVLAIVAFFLMKGGSSGSNDSFTPSPRIHHALPAAGQPPVIKLPKHVVTPVGRDPFKALYVAPVAAVAGPTTGGSASTPQQSPGTTTTSTGTTTPPKVTYHPVWVQLKSLTSTSATFVVGYSNGKTLKGVQYSSIKPLRTFASSFELLSIRNGVATLKYGDGSPFKLDRTHSTMVVD